MKFLAYINGKFIEKQNNIKIFSPETKKLLGIIPDLNTEDIDNAYLAAHSAFKEWSNYSPQLRAEFMIEFAALLKEHTTSLATILSSEIAKNIKDSVIEIQRTVEYIIETVHAYLNFFENPLSYSINNEITFPKNKHATYLPAPYGVALTISPFNYPVNLALSKIIPALIVGNTVVHKSATYGSLVGSYLAQLFDKVKVKNGKKFPPGVFNYVTGKGIVIGDYLYQHKACNLISFTGSTKVGLNIPKYFAMKPYSLEMGGNNAAIILEDADLDLAAKQILKGAFNYSGQRCTATKRVFIDKKISTKFFDIFLPLVNKLTVGSTTDNADITSVISLSKVEEVKFLYNDAIQYGATSLTGPLKIKDQLIYPVILINVNSEAKIMKCEQFAPILPFCEFNNINSMIESHNNDDYGLQSDIFTTNITTAKAIASKLEVATVNINAVSSRGPDILPFFGIKKSGFNVQGIIGSLKFFSWLKGIVYNSFLKEA